MGRFALSQRAALRAILVSNSIFLNEAPMHDSPQSHRILSSDTATLWLLGLAIAIFGYVPGVSDQLELLHICWTILVVALALYLASVFSGFIEGAEAQS